MNNRLRTLWQTLTRPSPAITSPIERRKANLLSGTLLAVFVLAILSQAVNLLFQRTRSVNGEGTFPILVYSGISIVALSYAISRTRYYNLAFFTVVWMALVNVFAIGLYANKPPDLDFLVYSLIPLIFTTIFASSRHAFYVLVITILGMVAIPLIKSEMSLLDVAAGPLSYIVIAGGTQIFATYYRDLLDEMHRAQVADTEQRYQALFNYANDGILILDFKGTYLDANDRMARLLGRDLDELTTTSIFDVLPPEEHEDVRARLQDLVSGDTPPIYERVLIAKDDTRVPVEISSTLVRDQNGDPAYIQNVIRDVTAREEARRTLQRRHRDLMVLNRIISAATSVLDDGKILQTLCGELAYAFDLPHTYAIRVHLEQSCAPIIAEYAEPGLPRIRREEIPLNLPAFAHVVHQRTALCIREPATDPRLETWAPAQDLAPPTSLLLIPLLVRNRVVSVLIMELPAPDVLSVSDMELIHNAAAAVAQAIETATLYQQQQQRAEELSVLVEQRTAALRDALVQAQAADQAKSQFVSNVSHELRTPLTSIRLYLELISRSKSEHAPRHISALTRETQRLQHLVDSLLLVSRLDLKQIQPDFATVNLNVLIETLVTDRQALFSDRKLTLSADPEPALPPVKADPRLIEQVLTNLLTNAMNYTPEGGDVRVRTSHVQNNGQSWVTLAVEDTGFGIAPEEQAKLFQRFERGQASMALQVPGTGLGLAISKEIVTLHGGRITVKSALGAGSTFSVWLPTLEPEADAAD